MKSFKFETASKRFNRHGHSHCQHHGHAVDLAGVAANVPSLLVGLLEVVLPQPGTFLDKAVAPAIRKDAVQHVDDGTAGAAGMLKQISYVSPNEFLGTLSVSLSPTPGLEKSEKHSW